MCVQIQFAEFSRKGDNAKLAALLRSNFDEQTTAWLLREMGENRRKEVQVEKSYSFPDLAALAMAEPSHAERLAQLRRAKSSCGTHDYLGSPALITKLSSRAELLADDMAALSVGEGAAAPEPA